MWQPACWKAVREWITTSNAHMVNCFFSALNTKEQECWSLQTIPVLLLVQERIVQQILSDNHYNEWGRKRWFCVLVISPTALHLFIYFLPSLFYPVEGQFTSSDTMTIICLQDCFILMAQQFRSKWEDFVSPHCFNSMFSIELQVVTEGFCHSLLAPLF